MHKCGTFCIFRSADRCHDWGDTGTDILTQNDRNCRSKGDLSGRGKCLKNTDGCGRTLDNSGDAGTGQNTENRVGEVLKQCDKFRNFFQWSNSIAHLEHTEEQDAKSQQNLSQIFLGGFLSCHKEDDTDDRDDRCPGGWF